MIAVTIGVGPYADMASHAAELIHCRTGLTVRILTEQDMSAFGLPDPLWLKFRLFDAVDADDVLYFDADQVCLRDWNPQALADPEAVVAVRDLMSPEIIADAADVGVPPSEYFNAGLFIVNRRRHLQWLRLAEEMIREGPPLRFRDQTALNRARAEARDPIRLLDRRYNWVRYGEGSLCHRLPVVMAHRVSPDDNGAVMRFHEGRFRLAKHDQFRLDEMAIARESGRTLIVSVARSAGRPVLLRGDGTLVPPEPQSGAGYWFVYDQDGQERLALASAMDVVATFELAEDGAWVAVEKLRDVDPVTASVTACIERQRWFDYDRVGHDRRLLELLPGGEIGRGRGGCEEAWHVTCVDGKPLVVLRGRGQDTCRLEEDLSALGAVREGPGSWGGHWLVHEQMPVRLVPCPSPERATAVATKRSHSLTSPSAVIRSPSAMPDPARVGVMGYAATGNLGDPAQVIALLRLLGRPATTVTYRESFARDARRDVLYVVNAFLCDDVPAAGRNYFFCGVHIHNREDENVAWVRRSPYPVGARDPYTQHLLRHKGVAAELIGCATLTLPRYDGPRYGTYAINADGSEGATVLSNDGPGWQPHTWERLWTDAVGRLETIRTARLVVTSKLHVALPCLAYGTPLVFDRRRAIHRERLTLLDELGVRDGTETVMDVSDWARRYNAFLSRVVPTGLPAPPVMPTP